MTTISRYDKPDSPQGVRDMFVRIQGFTTTLSDYVIKKMVAAANKKRRKYSVTVWDDLTHAMYEAERKIKMPTVWYRFRWTSTGGNSAWEYEDSRRGDFTADSLRAIMEDRISERAAFFGRAGAEWDIIDPPRAVVNRARNAALDRIEREKRLVWEYGEKLGKVQ